MMSLSKVAYVVALILFLLALVVEGPLMVLGLAALAAGHVLE